VGERLDVWRQTLTGQLTNGTLSEVEQTCLSEFLRVLSNLRPYLVQCYNRKDFPRTNNELERCIRGLKMQYRRVSGRKNWNSYLLRYGRSVAYAAWWEQDAAHQQPLEQRAARLDRTRLSRVPTGNQSRSERAAQALSLPSQTSAVSRFPGGPLGCCHFNVTFALTVFFQPVHLHFQLADLLIETGNQGFFCFRLLARSRREDIRQAIQCLLLPLRDLRWMDSILSCNLIGCSLPFDGF
jgi:hypothetical protein